MLYGYNITSAYYDISYTCSLTLRIQYIQVYRRSLTFLCCRSRPKSAHSGQGRQPSAKEENSVEVMMRRENLLEDRIQLANTISVLEGESEDTLYSSEMTDDVLPEAAEDLSSG